MAAIQAIANFDQAQAADQATSLLTALGLPHAAGNIASFRLLDPRTYLTLHTQAQNADLVQVVRNIARVFSTLGLQEEQVVLALRPGGYDNNLNLNEKFGVLTNWGLILAASLFLDIVVADLNFTAQQVTNKINSVLAFIAGNQGLGGQKYTLLNTANGQQLVRDELQYIFNIKPAFGSNPQKFRTILRNKISQILLSTDLYNEQKQIQKSKRIHQLYNKLIIQQIMPSMAPINTAGGVTRFIKYANQVFLKFPAVGGVHTFQYVSSFGYKKLLGEDQVFRNDKLSQINYKRAIAYSKSLKSLTTLKKTKGKKTHGVKQFFVRQRNAVVGPGDTTLKRILNSTDAELANDEVEIAANAANRAVASTAIKNERITEGVTAAFRAMERKIRTQAATNGIFSSNQGATQFFDYVNASNLAHNMFQQPIQPQVIDIASKNVNPTAIVAPSANLTQMKIAIGQV